MTRWVLDDGPFGLLAMACGPTWRWKPSSFHLTQAIAAGAANDRSGRRGALLGLTVGGQRVVEEHAPSAQARTTLYSHLRPDETSATRDLGEDESIAVLLHDLPDAVFVLIEIRATRVALAELGHSRVATPFDYWAWLRDEGIIDGEAFDDLCNRLTKKDAGLKRPLRFR
jgi:hypothetical protein